MHHSRGRGTHTGGPRASVSLTFPGTIKLKLRTQSGREVASLPGLSQGRVRSRVSGCHPLEVVRTAFLCGQKEPKSKAWALGLSRWPKELVTLQTREPAPAAVRDRRGDQGPGTQEAPEPEPQKEPALPSAWRYPGETPFGHLKL